MRRKQRLRSIPSVVVLSVLLASSATFGQEVRDREAPGVVPGSERFGIQPQYLPPGIQNPGPFKLGILARNTQTGVQLTQVLPGSVAQRAGLEAGDTIVTVGGYQVGYVSGRLYDMGEELARRVDRQGRVTLLVRNHRDGRLVNVPVQFTTGPRTVSGSVHAKGTLGLSRTATLTVRLLDVTQPRWRDVTIAEVQLAVPQRWPARYRLEVDPASIRSGHRYAVDARVTDRGQRILQTAGPLRVELSGDEDRIDLTLIRTIDRPPSGGVVPYDQITP
jgi:putative lipoprotein